MKKRIHPSTAYKLTMNEVKRLQRNEIDSTSHFLYDKKADLVYCGNKDGIPPSKWCLISFYLYDPDEKCLNQMKLSEMQESEGLLNDMGICFKIENNSKFRTWKLDFSFKVRKIKYKNDYSI